MEFLKFDNEEISKKFNEWWVFANKGNVPISHPSDLDRFAELIKLTYNKQDIFNVSILHDFLYSQLEKGNLNKNQENKINSVIDLYSFSVNHLLK